MLPIQLEINLVTWGKNRIVCLPVYYFFSMTDIEICALIIIQAFQIYLHSLNKHL